MPVRVDRKLERKRIPRWNLLLLFALIALGMTGMGDVWTCLIAVIVLCLLTLIGLAGNDEEDLFWYTRNGHQAARRDLENRQIVTRYRAGYEVEDIAQAINRSVPSVRGVLVSRYLYKKIEPQRVLARARRQSREDICEIEFFSGQTIDREQLLGRLLSQGYKRVVQVSAPGEFAVRGGLVDIHQWKGKHVQRLDFFGDTIEKVSRLQSD